MGARRNRISRDIIMMIIIIIRSILGGKPSLAGEVVAYIDIRELEGGGVGRRRDELGEEEVGVIRGDDGGEGGAWGHVGVVEVGASPGAADGACGTVVGEGGLLCGVECTQPVPLLCRRVPYLRRISPPGTPPHSEIPAAPGCSGIGRLLLTGFLLRRRRRGGGGGRGVRLVGEVHGRRLGDIICVYI